MGYIERSRRFVSIANSFIVIIKKINQIFQQILIINDNNSNKMVNIHFYRMFLLINSILLLKTVILIQFNLIYL